MAVSVQFEIGHTAKLRAKKTPEGFTHDWDLYVRGSNKLDISAYVDKVVFNLHESFQRPKRVIKEPPYVIHESGYASFILNIDIYFRNRDEPKRVQYTYDLDLQQHGPPHHRSEEKKFLFENPSEEFRQKLLKGGGVPVVPSGLTGNRSSNPNILPSSFSDSSNTSTAKHKSNNSNTDGSSSTKKHKSRIDDSKLNTFANLFGTPDSGAKNSSSISTKTTAETLKTTSVIGAGKIYSPSSTNTVSSNSVVKDKLNKEVKEKPVSTSGSAEKLKEKSERKEKHKSVSKSSPSKEARSENKKSSSTQLIESSKSEKRSEDKPKKDKSRDKERDRNRSEQNSNISTNSSSTKSVNIIKSSGTTSTSQMSITTQLMTNAPVNTTAANTSVQRPHTSLPQGALSRPEEKTNVSTKSEKPEKLEKETKDKHSSSSSSGKKSKKEKKDKEKDRDKDKERDKEKRNSGETKSKDDRTHISALQSSISNSPSGHTIPNTLSNVTQSKSKKSEKDTKQDIVKSKSSNLSEKSVDKQVTTPTSTSNNGTIATTLTDKKTAPLVNNGASNSNNSSSSATKTHKHKKKDKNKEKDKDRSSGGDKEKEKSKEKHKEKLEDKRETEKATENSTTKSITPELKKTITTPINLAPTSTVPSVLPSQPNNNATSITIVENAALSKKTQSKEKKSKDSKTNKDAKRRSEPVPASVTSEPKSKVTKTSTPLSTAGSNIELSDADSRQSMHDTLKSTPAGPNVAPISSETPELHSDSSYSSFPDIHMKQSEKPITPPSIPSPEKGNIRASVVGSKENKLRERVKNSTKPTEKSSKSEKEEKKRRRNTVTASNETTTFVEPPLKQVKKEQNKATTTRDSTKSPLPRSNTGSSNAVAGAGSNTNANSTRANTKTQGEAHIQSVDMTSTLLTASPNAAASAPALAPNAITNHANSILNNLTQQRTTPLPASPALNNETIWPNLSELQELHRKIMTLQDNDDLQQVVEMIAASGCYELTQRTFDFDLCKLDRSTVERLQEFFATSVS